MKNAIIVIFAVSLMPVLGCCSHTTDGSDVVEKPARVLWTKVTSKGFATVAFMTRAEWGNGCGTFSRSEVLREGSVYSIKVYGKEPKNAACPAVMISFDAPVTIELPTPGTYQFKFWQSDSTNIDTTFTVK